MKSIFEPSVRDALLARVDRLTPDRPPLWGRLTAPQMICHVSDQMRQALGELEARPMRGPLAHAPINWFVIYVLPWPKGKAKSPPEFLARRPASWDADLAACKQLIRRVSERGPEAAWPASPVFGRISGKDWGALVFKHLDHHLRQFAA